MELDKKLVNFESMNENTKLTLAEALLYTKGLAGGYGGDFPLSTASKDSIYRVPATNKFYVCTENYNGSQISAPNSNFVELSVWKNHDRLNNLCEIITVDKGVCFKYSSGILEYLIKVTAEKTGTKYNFQVPFKDKNYQCVGNHSQASGSAFYMTAWSGSQSTSEYITLYSDMNITCSWFIKGFWK